MSVCLSAVFPGADAADLAVMSLREKGCRILARETRERLHPGVTNQAIASRFDDFSPLPLQDGGTLLSMRLPGMPPVAALNAQGLASTIPGGVVLTIRVPEASAELAERQLYSQGAGHVRRLS